MFSSVWRNNDMCGFNYTLNTFLLMSIPVSNISWKKHSGWLTGINLELTTHQSGGPDRYRSRTDHTSVWWTNRYWSRTDHTSIWLTDGYGTRTDHTSSWLTDEYQSRNNRTYSGIHSTVWCPVDGVNLDSLQARQPKWTLVASDSQCPMVMS